MLHQSKNATEHEGVINVLSEAHAYSEYPLTYIEEQNNRALEIVCLALGRIQL